MNSWLIFENTVEHWLTPAKFPDPSQGHNVIQPPTLPSRAEFEAFMEDMRQAADRVFGPIDSELTRVQTFTVDVNDPYNVAKALEPFIGKRMKAVEKNGEFVEFTFDDRLSLTVRDGQWQAEWRAV